MILDVAPTELLVLGVVALLVIPPKDLPKAMRFAGQWIGRARGMARQFRSGFDDMIRESEFQEMEKKWKAENERIMREFPPTADQAALMAPVPQDDPRRIVRGRCARGDGRAAQVARRTPKPQARKPRAQAARRKSRRENLREEARRQAREAVTR